MWMGNIFMQSQCNDKSVHRYVCVCGPEVRTVSEQSECVSVDRHVMFKLINKTGCIFR